MRQPKIARPATVPENEPHLVTRVVSMPDSELSSKITDLDYDHHSLNSRQQSLRLQDSTNDSMKYSKTPTTSGPTPSIRLLFSCISWPHVILLLIPAIISSIVAGGIAPFTSQVIGQSFDAFTRFPLTPDPPQSAKNALLKSVGIAALELVALAMGALVLSSLTSCLWIWMGERNVREVRRRVYGSVMRKDMEWFDTKMGEGNAQTENDDGPLGAGGLMAKFTR
jgi:ATP-binding cassette, subfamily B (MDR/TAP), member 1